MEVGEVLARHAEDRADRDERQRPGELLDEVGAPFGREGVDELTRCIPDELLVPATRLWVNALLTRPRSLRWIGSSLSVRVGPSGWPSASAAATSGGGAAGADRVAFTEENDS
jgi:hypothetical protein